MLQLALAGSNDSFSLEKGDKAEYMHMHREQLGRCDGGRVGRAGRAAPATAAEALGYWGVKKRKKRKKRRREKIINLKSLTFIS